MTRLSRSAPAALFALLGLAACKTADGGGTVRAAGLAELDYFLAFAAATQLPDPEFSACREQVSALTVDQTLSAQDQAGRVFVGRTTPDGAESMLGLVLRVGGKEVKCLTSAAPKA